MFSTLNQSWFVPAPYTVLNWVHLPQISSGNTRTQQVNYWCGILDLPVAMLLRNNFEGQSADKLPFRQSVIFLKLKIEKILTDICVGINVFFEKNIYIFCRCCSRNKCSKLRIANLSLISKRDRATLFSSIKNPSVVGSSITHFSRLLSNISVTTWLPMS